MADESVPNEPVGKDREPSAADRPPASRVGDELQARADQVDDERSVDGGEIEREAYAEAQRKGWDKPLT